MYKKKYHLKSGTRKLAIALLSGVMAVSLGLAAACTNTTEDDDNNGGSTSSLLQRLLKQSRRRSHGPPFLHRKNMNWVRWKDMLFAGKKQSLYFRNLPISSAKNQ